MVSHPIHPPGSATGEMYFGPRYVVTALQRPIDVNLEDLPYAVYACFVLHNFSEVNGESVMEKQVEAAIQYDCNFQPAPSTAPVSNNTESKSMCRVLTRYFDPY